MLEMLILLLCFIIWPFLSKKKQKPVEIDITLMFTSLFSFANQKECQQLNFDPTVERFLSTTDV